MFQVLLSLALMLTEVITIFQFEEGVNIASWYIVDDVVMGGRSSGNFRINDNGHGVFSGKVSTENNGGFSSLRYTTGELKRGKTTKVVLKIKGDGKKYQFRLKDRRSSYLSYVYNFQTIGEWEEVIIPLNEMYPSFRGRRLKMDNYSSSIISEIGILIANKKTETFELLIDEIYLK